MASRSGQIEQAIAWLKPSRDSTRVTVCTLVYHWDGHWDNDLGRAVRCFDGNCRYCDQGRSVERRYVIGVKTSDQRRYLLELRKRQKVVIEELKEMGSRSVGAVLRVVREGEAYNAPVTVELMAMPGTAERWEIEMLVGSFGQIHDAKSSDA